MRFRAITFVSFLAILLLPVNSSGQSPPAFHHISSQDGLSNNSVIVIEVDQRGFVWVGTNNGLSRLDGERTTVYRHNPLDPTSIPNPRIDAIYQAKDGEIWIGTQNGLARYDPLTDAFERIDLGISSRVVVHDIDEDPNGLLYLSTWAHGLITFDSHSRNVRRVKGNVGILHSTATVRQVNFGESGRTWLSAGRDIWVFDGTNEVHKPPEWPISTLSTLKDVVVFRMLEFENGLWLATTKGLMSISLASGELKNFAWGNGKINTDSDWQIVRALEVDSKNQLWIGTHGGLAKYDSQSESFEFFENDPTRTESLASGTVHSIQEDHAGDLWVGSDAMGISLLAPFQKNITRIEASNFPRSKFPTGHVWSSATSPDGTIWLGLESGLGTFDTKLNTFSEVRPSNLPKSTVSEVYFNEKSELWIASEGNPLCHYLIEANRCAFFGRNQPIVFDMVQGPGGDFWMAQHGSLVRLNLQTGREQHFVQSQQNTANERVEWYSSLSFDSAGTLWVGTDTGLSRYDVALDGLVKVLDGIAISQIQPTHDGLFWLIGLDVYKFDPSSASLVSPGILPPEVVLGVTKSAVLDEKERLWVNLTNEVVSISNEATIINRFSGLSGRRSFEYPSTAHNLSRNGLVVMGIEDGLYVFHPDSLTQLAIPPVPVISGVIVDGQNNTMDRSSPFEVGPKSSVVTIQFSVPQFGSNRQFEYQVMLTGFESTWRKVQTAEASFTGLKPGEYQFHIKAISTDGQTGLLIHPFEFRVLAPWWLSRWFIVILVITGGSVIFGLYRWRTEDLQKQNRLLDQTVKDRTEQLASQAGQLVQAAEIRSRFFSNVSHELRTPITLISGYLEDLNDAAREMDPSDRQRITRARSLTNRMEGLVKQLFQLARTDGTGLTLDALPTDLVPLVHRIVSHFSIAAEKSSVDLTFECESTRIVVDCEALKMDQIVSNLLSNALKFTPRKGSVWVSLKATNEEVCIEVADTGPGISVLNQKRIFERFFQVENETTRKHDGLGIGLSLTYDLVSLHNGSIAVSSSEGEGSVFSVRFPRSKASVSSTAPKLETTLPSIRIPPVVERKKLLLVEDNEELRTHLNQLLSDLFIVTEAADGLEGWKSLQRDRPDIVLSDVMMPNMSGYDLLREIRLSKTHRDLPVVLLTARTELVDEVEGLEATADDFIGKPFNRKVLRARLTNLVRREMQQQESNKPFKSQASSENQAFLNGISEYVLANLTNSDIRVADLASRLNVSERSFHRKTKELSGESAMVFVRNVRLDRGRHLLENDLVLSVSMAAQEIGFINVSHFSKIFEERFGINPKSYLA